MNNQNDTHHEKNYNTTILRKQNSFINDNPELNDALEANQILQNSSPTNNDTLIEKSNEISCQKTYELFQVEEKSYSNDLTKIDSFSPLQKLRRVYKPKKCPVFISKSITLEPITMPELLQDDPIEIHKQFPITYESLIYKLCSSNVESISEKRNAFNIGIILSGGPAPGGHNVIAGIYDYIKSYCNQSVVYGFKGGFDGLINNKYIVLEDDDMNKFRNSGGFDYFWSGRGKLTEENKLIAKHNAETLKLNGIIIVGGDGSNSNAALLAEYFGSIEELNCSIIGIPKTIDGDLINPAIEVSFGFDTAAKTYASLIGDLCTDCTSGHGVWHIIRIMGRSASHLTFECALQTRPNLVFVGEEVEKNNISLKQIVTKTANLILERKKLGKYYGIVLLSEGLISFIPEIKTLIEELSSQLINNQMINEEQLSEANRSLWKYLPEQFKNQLLCEREATGYIQVAKIATEKLLIKLISDELQLNNEQFTAMHHYFGYEGRCALPSDFDSDYCYNLGLTASCLITNHKNGYMACIKNLKKDTSNWTPFGVPFTRLMHLVDMPYGKIPAIKKQLLDLENDVFKLFNSVRNEWKLNDYYRTPGPIQFDGPCADEKCYLINPPTREELLSSANDDITKLGNNENECTKIGCYSKLQRERLKYIPELPEILNNTSSKFVKTTQQLPKDDYLKNVIITNCYNICKSNQFYIYELQPAKLCSNRCNLKIGIALLSRQSPGVQNIVWGVFDNINSLGGELYGFKYGANGIINKDYIILNDNHINPYKNMGGATLLGRGTNHLLSKYEMKKRVYQVAEELNLDGLVLVGSPLAMTETVYLAEYFAYKQSKCSIIGVPAASSNNIVHKLIETNVGFDTASKVYANLIGNILADAASMPKYWHFIRIMGQQPSNEVLECALQNHPNLVVISEEYGTAQKTIRDAVLDIVDLICDRARTINESKNFGAVLIPDGLLYHLPTTRLLLKELENISNMAEKEGALEQFTNELLLMDYCDNYSDKISKTIWYKKLSPWSEALWRTFPKYIKKEFLTNDPELRQSFIETDVLLAELVKNELQKRKIDGKYDGVFQYICHYLGYQGRSAMPTNFDCNLAYVHGYTAACAVYSKLNGYMTTIRYLCNPVSKWKPGAVPLNSLLSLVHNQQDINYLTSLDTKSNIYEIPIISNNSLSLHSKAFKSYKMQRKAWLNSDRYINPGPIQYYGTLSNSIHKLLYEEQHEYTNMLEIVQAYINILKRSCEFGVDEKYLKYVIMSLYQLLVIRFHGDEISKYIRDDFIITE